MAKPEAELLEMHPGPDDERALLIAALDQVLGDEAVELDPNLIGAPPAMRPRFFQMDGYIHLELVPK